MTLPEITFEDVQKGLKDSALFLLGVRNPSELAEEGTIPGSSNIPFPELKSALSLSEAEFKDKYGFNHPQTLGNEGQLGIYCKLGGRATKAGDLIVSQLGLKNVSIYKGSFTDWVAKGGEVQKV